MNANKNIQWMGYSNHETWACQMWLKLDEEAFNDIKEYANLNHKIVEVAAYIKNIIVEKCPDLGPIMYRDLLYDSLSHINYYEVAQHIIDD